MKKDDDKSKQQLIEQLVMLRQQVAQLQTENLSISQAYERIKDSSLESDDRFRRLLELSFQATVIHRAGKIVDVNTAGTRLYGATGPEELVGRSVLEFIHPDCLDAVRKQMEQTKEAGQAVALIEERLLCLDGTTIDVEVAAIPIIHQGQAATQVAIRDISARKRIERALRESEVKFRTLAETTTAAVFIYQGSRTLFVNSAAEMISGYTKAELLNMDLLDVIHPDFRQQTKELRKKRLRGEPGPSQ